MELALMTNSSLLLSPLLPPSRFPLLSTSLSFPSALRIRRIRKNLAVFYSISASSDPITNSYGGWEDLQLPSDHNLAGKLDPVRSLLISIGINDQKHAVVFLLGFASAFLVSRIRFSLMVLFPVSALVFGAGFSAGLVQGGAMRRIGEIAGAVRVSGEKVRDLGRVFSDLDGKVTDLGAGLKDFFDSNGVEMGRIEDYLEALECVKSSIINAKKELESSLEMEMEKGRNLNQKPSKRKGDLGAFGFDFMRFLGSLFHENDVAVKQPTKAKEAVKGEAAEQTKSVVEKTGIVDKGGSKVDESREQLGRMKRNAPYSAKTIRDSHDMDEMNRKRHFGYRDGRYGGDMFSYDGEVGALNSRNLRFMYKEGSYRRTYFHRSYESHESESRVHSCIDPLSNRKEPENALDFYSMGPSSSSVSDDTFSQDRSYSRYNRSRNKGIENVEADVTGFQDESGELRDQSVEKGHTQSASTFSNDLDFSNLVMEASELIKQARTCLMSQDDQETADTILYRSASLLSAAVSMQPMSLLAVGQLGNTYLLHGELKLKISRELRTLLIRSDGSEGRRLWLKNLDTHGLDREKNVASVLIDVCEECEELLIEAGRKYRLALSIDGNDVRALYNWGLALSFRAQLIADIGPEAAFDADKVYLAAIDKFDAMVSKTNSHAPDALFRWGVTLQHRSHLRAHNSKEKMKLLQQAKSLFEDVLSVESNSLQVREALSSCISELNQRARW